MLPTAISWPNGCAHECGVVASGGHFYAQRLLQAVGIDPDHGVLRLSFVHYTTPDEIEQLIAAVPDTSALAAAAVASSPSAARILIFRIGLPLW